MHTYLSYQDEYGVLTWVHMDPHRLTYTYIGSNVLKCGYMDSHEHTWAHKGPHGLTWAHYPRVIKKLLCGIGRVDV